MNGRFSPYVIKALVDAITGGGGNDPTPPIGIYRSGPKIEQFFLDCGLDMRIGASSRVPATTDFLRRTTDNWDGDEHIKRVLLKVCDPREYLSEPGKSAAVREHLNLALEPDSLAITVVGGNGQQADKASSLLLLERLLCRLQPP